VTVPFRVIKEWSDKNFILPEKNFSYQPNLQPTSYRGISLDRNWLDYDIRHPLTDIGIERFCADWETLIR